MLVNNVFLPNGICNTKVRFSAECTSKEFDVFMPIFRNKRVEDFETVIDLAKDAMDDLPVTQPNSTKLVPTKVIFNKPATIVIWNDGSKTVVKCQKGKNGKYEKYDKEKGLALCYMKRMCNNQSNFNNLFAKWIDA